MTRWNTTVTRQPPTLAQLMGIILYVAALVAVAFTV